MNLSIKKLVTSGILITGLAVVGIGLAIILGTPASVSAEAHPCIQFTNGEKALGEPSCNAKADAVIVDFAGKAEVQFTMDGKNIGAPFPAPKKAKSFASDFLSNCDIVTFEYRDKKGNPLQPDIVVPKGANDFHFKTSRRITNFDWVTITPEGLVFDGVDVPKKADHIDFSCGG